ncbi:MAG TPA: YggT family protein [Rudaea sp.]|nr:YggT family protein [Rudaea sp.]
MSYLLNAAAFLVTTIFGFLICLFLGRMLLIAVGASFYEPVCRFVYALTNPVITPLRSVVPRWGRIELASLLVAWVLVAIELSLLVLFGGHRIGVLGVALSSVVGTLDWIILIELVAIFVYCVLSLFPAARYDGNFGLLARVVEPVVRPFRRLLPPVGGLDFSCWVASIALILVRLLVIMPLADLAAAA